MYETIYTSHWLPMMSNFITRLFMSSFNTTFFLPSEVFMLWTKADKKPDQDSCLSTTFTASDKGAGCTEHGEKTLKIGLQRWRRTMQEGGCQVLWSGILLPTPTKSPFLPAMHTVVYTWATINQVCWKNPGRTIKQWGCGENQWGPWHLQPSFVWEMWVKLISGF